MHEDINTYETPASLKFYNTSTSGLLPASYTDSLQHAEPGLRDYVLFSKQLVISTWNILSPKTPISVINNSPLKTCKSKVVCAGLKDFLWIQPICVRSIPIGIRSCCKSHHFWKHKVPCLPRHKRRAVFTRMVSQREGKQWTWLLANARSWYSQETFKWSTLMRTVKGVLNRTDWCRVACYSV